MRKIFTSLKSVVSAVIIAAMAFSVSCSYDDTAINQRVDKVEKDLAALTERVGALESKLQTEVDALEALINGKVVIVDRYVYSNIAYQCAKLSDEAEADRLRDWIFNTEYGNFALPVPDLNIFLDVPIDFVEEKLKKMSESRKPVTQQSQDLPDEYFKVLEIVGRYFDNNISLKRNPNGKGTMTIHFSSDDEVRKFLKALKESES